MAEVREFALPDLGEGLTEATITTWLVDVGEVVAVDQPVVEVETAKAMVEVPCPYGGVVTARYGDEGDEVPVGTPLVTVAVGADAGHAPETAAAGGGDRSREAAGAAEGGAAEGSGNVLVGYGTQAPSARRRRRAGPHGHGREAARAGGEVTGGPAPRSAPVPPGAAGGRRETGPDTGGHVGMDTGGHADRDAGGVAVISPLVRRVAREKGIDLREVTGSGPDGLILRADVEQAAHLHGHAPPQPSGAAAPPAAETAAPAARRIPLRGLRGTVADKLSRSRREIPDATTWVDADATELLAARQAMNAPAGAARISLLALLARICTAALARYPGLNSTVDPEAREIVRLDAVHLGFAAQTDRGLVVPVVRDAHTMGAEQLSAEIARLTESARAGTLTPAELTGGTFTLNNYGVFGVDGSTPIINHPEAAMLGVGRIAQKPWVVDGELAVRSLVQLSFTFDHRVCDGGTAGGFLRHVADCVEQPAVLLRTL